MREIKFRVLIGISNTIMYGCNVWAMNITEGVNEWQKKNILMQFTGLKDKNGKEIYEGDILKLSNGDTVNWLVKFGDYADDEGYSTGSHLGYYGERIKPHYNFTITTHTLNELDGEVIGNIYENPELLENK
jgi:uncharacterized phage protein (TIGR01671 family)